MSVFFLYISVTLLLKDRLNHEVITYINYYDLDIL